MSKIAYSVKELSEIGCGSESHIRRMIKSGQIPSVRLGERELVPAFWVQKTFQNQPEAE